MSIPKHSLIAAIAVGLLAIAGGALAHGDEKHPVGPVKLEQTDWGIAGTAKPNTRTVEVRMLDTMRFSPDRIEVKQGQTVRFVVHNDGTQLHEFVIGTRKTNDEHAALMLKFPGMEHSEPYMTHVPPGKTGEIVWKFNRAGEFAFACLIAGHYQAGMVGTITVATQ